MATCCVVHTRIQILRSRLGNFLDGAVGVLQSFRLLGRLTPMRLDTVGQAAAAGSPHRVGRAAQAVNAAIAVAILQARGSALVPRSFDAM
jgi:hypothetical protein